jgi:hypothetical protein
VTEDRISIGLPPASESFTDAVIDAINAVRAIRHHVLAGTARTEVVAEGVMIATGQGTAYVRRTDIGIEASYEPDMSAASGFERAKILLARQSYPDSELWTCAEQDLPVVMVSGFDPIVGEGTISTYAMGDGSEFGIVEGRSDEMQAEIRQLVEDLSNGTDLGVGGPWTVKRRWPAMGSAAAAVPVSDDGVEYAIPAETHASESMRQARMRLLMIQRWMDRVAPALMAHRTLEGEIMLMPLSMTRSAPNGDEANEVRQRSVMAYHRLSLMDQETGS